MSSNIKYTIKNDVQHVLDCSDVYIGDTGTSARKEYVYSDEHDKIVCESTSVPEALVRIFVEVLTNAVDNVERSKHDNPCRTIKVALNIQTGLTTVWNDGQTIPIIKNKDQTGASSGLCPPEGEGRGPEGEELGELYVHSLIFGHLRSSSNYGNEEVRELSGKNGVGVKCTNIFSSYFRVTGVDPTRGLKLEQEWTRNMGFTAGPKVERSQNKGYTEIKYIPDFPRFGLTSYPKEIYSMFKKLVVDVSALLPQTDFWFCGRKVETKGLADYSKLYYAEGEEMDSLSLNYKGSDIVVIGSEAARPPVSFVNGQITKEGGQHVQSWTKTVFSAVLEALNNKKDVKFTKADIAPYFQLFVHSRVNKPRFDGQNKNALKNPKVESKLEKSPLNKILKWGVIGTIKDKVLRNKELCTLKKIEGTRKTVKIDGYDPANKLGTDSILIICEGLSAKSYAVAGIQTGIFGKRGRNHFGILPLRGKFLNVKNASVTKIGANKVVSDLIKAFNLKFGLDYSEARNYKSLNYGTLLILTDADKDGIHIKGLVLNFLHELFPTLFKRQGFVVSMETPIVKLFKAKKELLFYDENTFEEYAKTSPANHKFKYYKGLGTISPKDVSLFFGKKLVTYNYSTEDEAVINKVFKDDSSNERKLWLNGFDPKVSRYCLDALPDNASVKVGDFMEHEMVKFSYEDCKRSLASCIDGLKESQRKVVHAVRKKFKNKNDFVKVAQLSGYVAEHTDYKHGEQNLCETIIKFAQDFVGTNNLPLLEADGQFGTRLEGGKDSAASRYICTKPKQILNYIFREEDDQILEYSMEGEPVAFVPVIPLVLINGSVGIGTGWSCSIPQYNPLELVNFICSRLKGERAKLDLDPYYKGFRGKIKPVDQNKLKYTTFGKMKRVDERTIQVTELPVGMWTDKFKEHCETLLENGTIRAMVNDSTIDQVNFTLKGLVDTSAIKLTSTLHTTNMVLFNNKNIITKYETIDCILQEFFKTRLRLYKLRKDHQLSKLSNSISLNESKLNFILKVVEDSLFLKQEDEAIMQTLEKDGFQKVNNSYNYLLNMPVRGCTVSAVNALRAAIIGLKQELVDLEQLSAKQMWLRELDEIRPFLSQ